MNPHERDFDLGEFLPYLVNRVGVGMVRAFEPELEHLGVSLGMWRVLAALWQTEGINLATLAARTSIEVSTLSRTVSALRRQGLVRSTRRGQDGREVQIALSSKGRALTARIIPLALDFEARMVLAIPLQEMTTLRRVLRRLYANLRHPKAGD